MIKKKKKGSVCVYAFIKSEVKKSFPRTGYGAGKMKHRLSSFRIRIFFFWHEAQPLVSFS